MRPFRTSLIAAATVFCLSPTLAAAQSTVVAPGGPEVGTQQQLGNCNLSMWLPIVGRLVQNVNLPANARVIHLRNETVVAAVHNFDLSRLSVVTSRYGHVTRVYCG